MFLWYNNFPQEKFDFSEKGVYDNSMLIRTTIDHGVRDMLDINNNEYVAAEVIYHLSKKNGKCVAKRDYLAKCVGVTTRGLRNIISTLIDKGIVSKNKDGTLSYTDKWYSLTVVKQEKISYEQEKSSDEQQEKSSSLYNNSIIYIPNTLDESKEAKKEEVFSLEEFYEKYNKSGLRMNQLIVYYMRKAKGMSFPDKKSAEREFSRHRKISKALVESYTNEQIKKAMEYCSEKFEDKWTLETVSKKLPEIFKNL